MSPLKVLNSNFTIGSSFSRWRLWPLDAEARDATCVNRNLLQICSKSEKKPSFHDALTTHIQKLPRRMSSLTFVKSQVSLSRSASHVLAASPQ